MGIVTTEQAVRAKARSIADRYFKTGHVSPSEDKAELVKLIEDAFLVDPPGAVGLRCENCGRPVDGRLAYEHGFCCPDFPACLPV